MDINTADESALSSVLKPAMASRVVSERAKGNYTTMEEVKARVAGLGDQKIKKLTDAGFIVGAAAVAEPAAAEPAVQEQTAATAAEEEDNEEQDAHQHQHQHQHEAPAEAARWDANPRNAFPPEFTIVSVRARPSFDHTIARGRVTWHDQTFTQREWALQLGRWEEAYPNITVKTQRGKTVVKSTRHETEAQRGKATADPKNRLFCWEALPRNHYSELPKEIREHFREDSYGNVVSDKATRNSGLCFFDVDHIWPWSRGGRSVQANFEGVQWAANRWPKSDNIVPSLDLEAMQCGLSMAQLKALVAHAKHKAMNKSRGANWTHNLDKLVYWLTHGPSKDHALTNFALDTNRTTDGAALWSFFEAWSKRADAAADVDADVGRKSDGRIDSRALAAAAEDKAQPTVPAPRTLAQPVIHLSTNHSMVECHGPATYQLR